MGMAEHGNQYPIVTFVMPAYNVEHFIKRSVGSIKAQTITDWHLVIVDDGSTDDTLQIANKLAADDNRIKVIGMTKGSGSAFQPRMRGILSVETELVSPLDADDYIAPDYLEKMLQVMTDTGADIVYPTMFTEEEEIITPKKEFDFNRTYKGAETVKFTLDGWRINCNGGIIRKKIYEKVFRLYDSGVTYSCADELLTRRLLFHTRKVAFSDARYFYYINRDSITRKKSMKLFEYLINNRELISFTKENYGENSVEYLLAHRQNFHGIFNGLLLMNKYKFNSEEKRIILAKLSENRRLIDRNLMKGNVSPRYMFLMNSGLKLSGFAMKIREMLKS